MLVKGQSPFSDGCNHSHVVNELRTADKLPCKYPRFTRFMTSLAVRLETSSTSQRREERRVRERREERSRWGREGGREGTRKKNQAGSECICSFKTELLKKGESDAKKPCSSCVHRITSKLFICHMLWSCRSNPHWHSWFLRRSWAFGVLPETYSIDTLHCGKQVQTHLEHDSALGGKREAGRRERTEGQKRRSEPIKSAGKGLVRLHLHAWLVGSCHVVVSLCDDVWGKGWMSWTLQ